MATKEEREMRVLLEGELAEFLQEQAARTASSEARKISKAALTSAGREMLFLDQFEEALTRAFKNKIVASKPVKAKGKTKKVERTLNLLISDVHYQSLLNTKEHGHEYGPVQEARRTAHVFKQTANYKLDHRDETKLNLHIIGDIIQGQLHDPRDGAPLAEQVAAAIRYLSQGIVYLSSQFPRGVTVRCAVGNHGRNTARHRDRAINQKWDSIEMMIYVALKQVAEFIPNCEVLLDYPPEYYWTDYGETSVATHGDTTLNPGWPGKSIDVANIARQVDRLNNARILKKQSPVKVVAVGHVHTGSVIHLPGGVVVVTNGCLIPPDDYAHSQGFFSTRCGQQLWESTPGHVFGDSRFIEVGEDVDKDETLDEIIRPHTGL